MDGSKAKKIGSRQALISVTIGLVVAQLIMTLFSSDRGFIQGLFWFKDFGYNLNILVGAVIMYACGYLFGQFAGTEILVEKRSPSWVGFKYGFFTVIITAFLASLVGFFQEGLNSVGTDDNPFIDYIAKPVFWVSVFGFIPTILVGLWFGRRIKTRGAED